MIVLDAAGTLLELEHPVGEAYAEDARAAGTELDPDRIEAGFARAMADAPPLAFGDRPAAERRVAERAWWRSVARKAVEEAGADEHGLDFDRFFDRAWSRFAEPAAWRVFPDVRPALRAVREAGVPLAVFSNWDGRLPGLLGTLGLSGFFTRVVVSSALRHAKPDPAAFAEARAAIGEPAEVGIPTMVGDRRDHDVEAALAAGWRAVWLDRRGEGGSAPGGAARIESLEALPGLLEDLHADGSP